MDDLEEIEGEDVVETLKRWRDENNKRNSFFGDIDGKEEERESKEGGRVNEEEERNEREKKRKERENYEIKLFNFRNLRLIWHSQRQSENRMCWWRRENREWECSFLLAFERIY